MFLVMGRSTSYLDPTGFAAAKIDVRAFNVVMIPALAIETVCCSCVSETRVRQIEESRRERIYHDFM